jgi:hypothetical protein
MSNGFDNISNSTIKNIALALELPLDENTI